MSAASGSHKERLKGLYAITDEKLIAAELFSEAIESALQGGVRIIQYRDKSDNQKKRLQQATVLRALCTRYQATCIINDDIELARAVDADGIHLGKDDAALAEARQALGEDCIIGISCYNDIERAVTAEKGTADYVAFGTMFSSPTKPEAVCAGPDIISQSKQRLNLPVCAIGGITGENIQQLIQHQVDMAAVISSLFAADDIRQSAEKLSGHFR